MALLSERTTGRVHSLKHDLLDVEQMMVSLFLLLILCRRETLPSARTADLSEEKLDSDDDDLPSVKQTGDDDDDREGDDG
jgi:hypothetical protein